MRIRKQILKVSIFGTFVLMMTTSVRAQQGYEFGFRFRQLNFRPTNFNGFSFTSQTFRPLNNQPIQFRNINFPPFNRPPVANRRDSGPRTYNLIAGQKPIPLISRLDRHQQRKTRSTVLADRSGSSSTRTIHAERTGAATRVSQQPQEKVRAIASQFQPFENANQPPNQQFTSSSRLAHFRQSRPSPRIALANDRRPYLEKNSGQYSVKGNRSGIIRISSSRAGYRPTTESVRNARHQIPAFDSRSALRLPIGPVPDSFFR